MKIYVYAKGSQIIASITNAEQSEWLGKFSTAIKQKCPSCMLVERRSNNNDECDVYDFPQISSFQYLDSLVAPVADSCNCEIYW